MCSSRKKITASSTSSMTENMALCVTTSLMKKIVDAKLSASSLTSRELSASNLVSRKSRCVTSAINTGCNICREREMSMIFTLAVTKRIMAYKSRYGIEIPRGCGSGSGPILLDQVKCSGNESSLADCERLPWGEHNCVHSEDAACRCCENAVHCGREKSCQGSWITSCLFWKVMPRFVNHELSLLKSHAKVRESPAVSFDKSCQGSWITSCLVYIVKLAAEFRRAITGWYFSTGYFANDFFLHEDN